LKKKRLFVCEGEYGRKGNDRVSVFDVKSGEFLSSFGNSGSGREELDCPFGICYYEKKIYVADCFNHRCQIWNEEGVYIGEMCRSYLESYPVGITIRDGNELFLAEHDKSHITIWDLASGTYLRSFGGRGSRTGQIEIPYSMTILSQKELILCDTGNNRLQIFE